jgi:thiamine biosynthesis lipoprotein
MHTRFEIALHGGDPIALRAAGEEALDEIDRLEDRLSLFRPISEIAHLNARAASEAVRVTPEVLALLRLTKQLHAETGGAFDPTIAPLLDCWGLLGGTGRVPTPEEIAAACACVGMGLVELDERQSTVRFTRPGVRLDLGAIGKGCAIDRAAEILRDAGVTSALLHGGTSTVYALGVPPGSDAWSVAIEGPPAAAGQERQTLATVQLRDESLSVSAIWGKFFTSGGQTFGHILNPQTGRPAHEAVLAAVVLPSATDTDALSTALLALGPGGHERLAALRPGMKTLLASTHPDGGPLRMVTCGIAWGARLESGGTGQP